jgi:hypothetical protein
MLRILTHEASFFSFVMYFSPVALVRWIAFPRRMSEPLPLPKRSFIKLLPKPTAFLDFGRTIVDYELDVHWKRGGNLGDIGGKLGIQYSFSLSVEASGL